MAALPEAERELLASRASLVDLPRKQVLYDANRSIEGVYFLTDGIASVLSVMRDGTAVETATIGREGMIGMALFHGVDMTAEQAMVQVSGRGFRVDAETFRELLPQMPSLTRLLHRFSVVMFTLAAQNSGCNRKHSIEQRCCRWLLMVLNRLDRNTFDLTHDFIAQMLGVRRASVTETLGLFEKRGLIEMGRGRITVVDPKGLEACCCECHSVIESTVDRLLRGERSYNPIEGVPTSSGGQSTLRPPFG
ncbi:MAG TPA: Crp/Fnr family transcriptional regulator [Gemmatimonadaceae bacterium]|nr:Crp/Fnr family transcriptional regulator [Gemmatimonadaceae bacterium]